MNTPIAAYTDPSDSSHPDYISVEVEKEGTIAIHVRALSGINHASIRLSPEAWLALLLDAARNSPVDLRADFVYYLLGGDGK